MTAIAPQMETDITGEGAHNPGRCTCPYHRALRRQAQSRYRAQRIADFKAGLRAPSKHDYSTYVGWGCRCDVCVASWIEYRAARRAAGLAG